VPSGCRVRTCNVPRGCNKDGKCGHCLTTVRLPREGLFFLLSLLILMLMVLTWTTLSDVSRDDSVSSSDDIFIIYLSFLSLFLLLRCWGEQMVYKKKNLKRFYFILAFSCVATVTGRVVFLRQNNTTCWSWLKSDRHLTMRHFPLAFWQFHNSEQFLTPALFGVVRHCLLSWQLQKFPFNYRLTKISFLLHFF